jgi:hypothetical protein
MGPGYAMSIQQVEQWLDGVESRISCVKAWQR